MPDYLITKWLIVSGGFSSSNRHYSTSPASWNSGACFSPTTNQVWSSWKRQLIVTKYTVSYRGTTLIIITHDIS